WPPGDVQRVKSTLERTASALQATEQRTEMLLWDLGILAGWPSDGSDLLTKGRDAGLVTMSETEVRFTHQLFQEYYATWKLRDLLDDYD
ncbi:hypothetical protein ACMWQD_28440, partial [Escherichia coli]|uniref:hypothetical protein n=1 Tax=Escherichia coli TaxID=562 RepID=UPI0039DFF2AF